MAGIYVHVPFCKQKCSYCDFASFPKEIGKAEAYFACLYKELKSRSLALKDKTFNTIYFGGGTPSFVEPKYIYGAVKQILTCFNIDKDAEITLEVNPGTIDENKLKIYKNAGINRFSIGLQTANENTLYKINRIHNVKDFENAVELLKDFNLSVDVMIGLPDEDVNDVKKTLDLATSNESVKHISVYALKAEEGTPMFTRYLNGELPSDDEVADIYDFVVDYLDKKGYKRYEVSNFSKVGFESKHNKNYWQRGEYLGVGVGASSFIENRRFTNTESIDEYVHAILNNKVAEVFSEDVVGDDAKAEYVMLALRTSDGVNLQAYKNTFNSDFTFDFINSIKKNLKYLNVTEKTVKIKDDYLYVQNTILVDFISEKQ
ncbi:MAG: radical SAM family heme chaperone HemW [Clostridiales bacterium]|nr:radical SAM family heme chaperone HemW [Clostridiales bacterium]